MTGLSAGFAATADQRQPRPDLSPLLPRVIPFDVIPAYLLTGAFAGFFAGLLGVGGGVVVVPVLTIIFTAQGFPAREVLHLALGTSMATILFTSLSSLRAHHAHQAVLWPVVRQLTPGILLGTLLGAQLAARISSRSLSIFFVGFMLLLAVQMIANLRPTPSRRLPGWIGLSAGRKLHRRRSPVWPRWAAGR
jgi:uncharacterized membrane protein YfcA